MYVRKCVCIRVCVHMRAYILYVCMHVLCRISLFILASKTDYLHLFACIDLETAAIGTTQFPQKNTIAHTHTHTRTNKHEHTRCTHAHGQTPSQSHPPTRVCRTLSANLESTFKDVGMLTVAPQAFVIHKEFVDATSIRGRTVLDGVPLHCSQYVVEPASHADDSAHDVLHIFVMYPFPLQWQWHTVRFVEIAVELSKTATSSAATHRPLATSLRRHSRTAARASRPEQIYRLQKLRSEIKPRHTKVVCTSPP